MDETGMLLRVPDGGEAVRVPGRELAIFCARALPALTAIRARPAGLRAALDRLALHDTVEVTVSEAPRRVLDIRLRRMVAQRVCHPQDEIMVTVPTAEGVAGVARSAGGSERMCISVPRRWMICDGDLPS